MREFRTTIISDLKRGYTLVELLIASLILAVIMLTVYSAFHTGVFGFRDIEENINIYQTARHILGRIDLDLRNSFVYSAGQETKFQGEAGTVSFLTLVDVYDDKSIRRKYAFVSYQVMPAEGDYKKIMRLCRLDKEALNDKSEATKPQEMASDVDGLAFSYCDKDTEGNLKDWQDSWPADEPQEKILPAAVKITLTIKKKQFTRTIFLPLA